MTDTDQLPPLPTLLSTRVVDGVQCISVCEHEYRMREYALQAIAHATQPAEVTDERQAFEKWLGIRPCGAAHDMAWSAWKARAILALRPVQVPMTREQAMAIVQSNPDTMTAIRMAEAHHGISAQAKKEDE